MSEQTSAREEILARIRTALHGEANHVLASHVAIARTYVRAGERDAEETLHMLLDRLIDYDTEIVELQDEGELAGAIEKILSHAGESRILVPAEFPQAWLPAGFEFLLDRELSIEACEGAQAVVTTCEVAVAISGTIFLVHGGAQGRRVITLLPDHHICLLRRDQVVETLPEALERLGDNKAKPLTTISGPSATSDIEMTRIRGVHGPRRFTVIMYGCSFRADEQLADP